jgi:hypothetical protein
MRSCFYVLTVLGCLVTNANAQKIQMNIDTNDRVTGLDPDSWATVAKKIIDAKSIVGTPMVYMVNASHEDLTVSCDKWQLVGDKPYIKGNPNVLRAFTVSLIFAEGFDGYCKSGVVGQTANGELYNGVMNAPDRSFSASTFITFIHQTKQ